MQKQPQKVGSSLSFKFLDFFEHKIESIRKEIDASPTFHLDRPTRAAPHAPPEATFLQFSTISLDELAKLTQASKPTTCMLDPLSTKVLKELFPTVGSAMLNIMNLSLSTGTVPSTFKTTVIKPLLKKPGLDPEVLSSYQPISNLPFLV